MEPNDEMVVEPREDEDELPENEADKIAGSGPGYGPNGGGDYG